MFGFLYVTPFNSITDILSIRATYSARIVEICQFYHSIYISGDLTAKKKFDMGYKCYNPNLTRMVIVINPSTKGAPSS